MWALSLRFLVVFRLWIGLAVVELKGSQKKERGAKRSKYERERKGVGLFLFYSRKHRKTQLPRIARNSESTYLEQYIFRVR